MTSEYCNLKHTELDKRLEQQALITEEKFGSFKSYCRNELEKTDKKIEDAIVLVKETNKAINTLTEFTNSIRSSIQVLEEFMLSFKSGQRDIFSRTVSFVQAILQALTLFFIFKFLN